MTAQDNGISEWQWVAENGEFQYWHEPSNQVGAVLPIGDSWEWQWMDYMGDDPSGESMWEVVAHAPRTYPTPEAAQAAAMAWLDEDGE